jgi:hypothetical protein
MDGIKKHWFFEDIKISQIPFKKRSFKQKIRVIRITILMRILKFCANLIIGELKNRQELKNKLKYFKPTIHEGFFSNKISWEQRNKPLTDTELKNIIN